MKRFIFRALPLLCLLFAAPRERFAPQGLEAAGETPEQFARLYREDYEKYGRLVKDLGIKLD